MKKNCVFGLFLFVSLSAYAHPNHKVAIVYENLSKPINFAIQYLNRAAGEFNLEYKVIGQTDDVESLLDEYDKVLVLDNSKETFNDKLVIQVNENEDIVFVWLVPGREPISPKLPEGIEVYTSATKRLDKPKFVKQVSEFLQAHSEQQEAE